MFSAGHWTMLNTKSFLCCRIIHGRPLFKRNQTWLKDFNGLLRGSSKRHCIFEKDYQGPRLPCLAKSCHMMLATYHHMCWASKQLKSLCSIDSTNCKRRWGQLWSVSTEICPCHSFTAIAATLWITDQRKVASFCALCLCQIMFQLGEVWGRISLWQCQP
jgi:hypothetical protein